MGVVASALVTGGGRGIGAAIARALAGAGARVFVAGRNQVRAAGVAEAIRSEGGAAEALQLDVTDRQSIETAARRAGPVDWLINNAGIAASAPLLPKSGSSNEELIERMLAVNLHGPRRLIEAFAPGMVERGSGVIVNVVSSAGWIGYPYTAAYSASKHALLGYTRVCALELGKRGVRVHAVCPHYVDSPMTDESVRRIVDKTGRSAEEARAMLAAQNPGGRLVSVNEVAAAVLELVQGQRAGLLIELDGGERPLVRAL